MLRRTQNRGARIKHGVYTKKRKEEGVVEVKEEVRVVKITEVREGSKHDSKMQESENIKMVVHEEKKR